MKAHALHVTRTAWLLIGVLAGLVMAGLLFHRQINRPLAVHLFLNSKNPREEFFDDLAKQSANPADFLMRAWSTGRITHRQLVASFLKNCSSTNPPWFRSVERLVVAGARDADASVRELALSTLKTRQDPQLFECAWAQLDDLDPLIRLLGLDYLRQAEPPKAVPLVMRLLDDPDLRVAASAEVALMRWSGEDYGVRARLAIPAQDGVHPSEIDPANLEIIKHGIQRRKAWWQLHAKDYPANATSPARPNELETSRFPVPDFVLHDLNGKAIQLTDFRGKVVILNFWATWCTACLAEIPDLIALQTKAENRVVILGVALDGVPDEHGHQPGAEGHDEDSDSHGPSLKAVRAKVARAVKARGINYPVLLDPNNSVGGQFNGGELPTTAIIDAEGRLRRRFIGERSVGVFESMIAEAAPPTRLHDPHSN